MRTLPHLPSRTRLRRLDDALTVPARHAYLMVAGATDRRLRAIPAYAELADRLESLSACDDVAGVEEWLDAHEQMSLMRSEIHWPPRWLEEALGVLGYNRPLRMLVNHVRWSRQRASRGFDDRDLRDLDATVCRLLGVRLIALSDVVRGLPFDDEFSTQEDWQRALRAHGAALERYAASNGDDIEAQAPAQESLRWVADHLPLLRD